MLTLLAMSSGAATLLWIIAAVLVIAGIVTLIRGGVLAKHDQHRGNPST